MASAEQLILDIESGSYDRGLAKIKEAVDKRMRAARLSLTVADYPIGTRVRFNEQTGTAYMRGQLGTVTGIRVKKVLVTLDTPMGRFERFDGSSASTVCPIIILDRI